MRTVIAPGAVVIGGDYMGLGIVRSLAAFGIATCVVDDERSIARFSRYAARSVRVPDLRDSDAALNSLLRVGRELDLEGWVLYPTRDETVAVLSQHRSALSAVFRVPTPPWNVIEVAWDKRRTYATAQELGVPIPATWYPAQGPMPPEMEHRFPLVVKPAIKEHFIYATKVKAWRADSPSELTALLARAEELIGEDEIMVQEMIPGDGAQQFAHCSFFKDGRSLVSMVVRRRRQHPPEFGRASTYVETADAPELEAASERFLGAIGYYGLVEVEYKLDARDGEFKLLDVNARTWGYHTVGLAAGVNFPYSLYRDQTGALVTPERARPGVRWIRLVTDLPTGLLEIRHGRLPWRRFIESMRQADVEAVFDRRDPAPFLREVALLPYLAVKRGF